MGMHNLDVLQYRHNVKNWGMTFLFHQSLCTLPVVQDHLVSYWNEEHWTCFSNGWELEMYSCWLPAAQNTPRELKKLRAVTKNEFCKNVAGSLTWCLSPHSIFLRNTFCGKITAILKVYFRLLSTSFKSSLLVILFLRIWENWIDTQKIPLCITVLDIVYLLYPEYKPFKNEAYTGFLLILNERTMMADLIKILLNIE